jgi:hypothetical protein
MKSETQPQNILQIPPLCAGDEFTYYARTSHFPHIKGRFRQSFTWSSTRVACGNSASSITAWATKANASSMPWQKIWALTSKYPYNS